MNYMLKINLRFVIVMILINFTTFIFAADEMKAETDPHANIYKESDFPSATECAGCHKKIYDEWSSSSHAYASISPMFHKFEQKINDLAPTIDNFCVRCHMSVGTTLGEERHLPLWERSQVSREGVTCVTCHRIDEQFGKANGERGIVAGDIYQPVYGPFGGDGVMKAIENKDELKIAISPKGRGKKIHLGAIKFEQLSESEFCVSCHQVAINLGIKLEVVWEQYRASPAFKEGITCQDCHMGKIPGVDSGYEIGPAAEVNGKTVNDDRKHSNHAFYGPGYSVAHPGLFPHNPEAEEWTVEEWLQYDYRAGWGSEDFEDEFEENGGIEFPEAWEERDDRETAFEVVTENIEKTQEKMELRKEVMENGSRLDGPFFDGTPKAGKYLNFSYKVTNTNSGHNLPSGSLGAQPEIWLNVALTNPEGVTVWESGYVDSYGDMADMHSLDVSSGKIKADEQLFNLQTKFLTTNVKGTDREMYLPVNFDIDQLPFLRPAQQPVSVMNHPPFVRMEGRSIPPLGSRNAKYKVPAELIKSPGQYKLSVRLRSRAEPIYFMKFVEATVDMERSMNEWMVDIHPYTVEFQVH